MIPFSSWRKGYCQRLESGTVEEKENASVYPRRPLALRSQFTQLPYTGAASTHHLVPLLRRRPVSFCYSDYVFLSHQSQHFYFQMGQYPGCKLSLYRYSMI
jgi:hypothetical protein